MADNRCPVCQARFRGTADCSRCGADLRPLMRIAVEAWQKRQQAREAMLRGEFRRAVELASQARSMQAHEGADSILTLARWMDASLH